MVTLLIGVFIGAFLGFVLAAMFSNRRSTDKSPPAPQFTNQN
jgi:hypothetical protein